MGRESVFLLRPTSADEREHPQYLLGQADLADYIRELAVAERLLDDTKNQLLSLGITD